MGIEVDRSFRYKLELEPGPRIFFLHGSYKLEPETESLDHENSIFFVLAENGNRKLGFLLKSKIIIPL